MIQEFKPVIFFLLKFLGIYFAGNMLYGLWVNAYEPVPDPATHYLTKQVSWLLNATGWENVAIDNPAAPTTVVYYQAKPIIAVFEGCNGINVFIIFLAFLVAFGPWNRQLAAYGFLGLAVLHVANLLRVGLLFHVALYFPDALYFFHKYLFTAFIYGVVFILWFVWIKKNGVKLRPGET